MPCSVGHFSIVEGRPSLEIISAAVLVEGPYVLASVLPPHIECVVAAMSMGVYPRVAFRSHGTKSMESFRLDGLAHREVKQIP